MRREAPSSPAEAASLLRQCGEGGLRVRFRGGGTKLGWGRPAPGPDLELSTAGLGRIVEHAAGDLTAVLEAGVPLARAQEAFAAAGQMLAIDPPLGPGEAATAGGVVAAGDSGPLRHRYGAPRDLVLGVTLALPDGTLARAGSRVIKNVAGYDLPKLLAGSFGTLGLIVQVIVRLHPLPGATATALGETADPEALGRAASALAHAPLQAECLDAAWSAGGGVVLIRFGGAAPLALAARAARLMEEAGCDASVRDDDAGLWREQREAQRAGAGGAAVRVSGLLAELPRIARAVERLGGALAGRAGAGLFWVRLVGGQEDLVAGIEEIRRDLRPLPCAVLDAPAPVREKVDVWGEVDGPALALMRRVKERFDPAGVCNPGIFVGGI